MSIDDMHRPTTDFREHLEWEVVSAFRRQQRLNARHHAQLSRWVRAAAIVIVSVAIGASATLASAQIRQDARRDSLIEAAKADVNLAALRLKLARDRFAFYKRRSDAGADLSSTMLLTEADLHEREAQVMRSRLNVEEVTASAQPPRDDLNAPVVKGRDFMKERLEADLMAAQQRLTAAENVIGEVERRVRAGASTELDRLDAEGAVTRARAALAVLAERLTLREEYLSKHTPVDQLTRKLEDFQLTQDAAVAQQALSAARARFEQVSKQQRAGAASDLELQRARLDVMEREVELQRVAQQLQARKTHEPNHE